MPNPRKPSDAVLEHIREYFEYEADTGNLYRVHQQSWVRLLVNAEPLWNTALSSWQNAGVQIRIGGLRTSIRITNICWYLYYKEWPTSSIDHIDVNSSNNRITNLRLANSALQAINNNRRCKYLPGVEFSKPHTPRPYRAKITIKGVRTYLGSFETEHEAHEAYKIKYKELYGEELPL